MEEIWKDIPGYGGLYQVSNLGRVRSFQRNKEKILKPYITRNGYLLIALYKDKGAKAYTVHRLVLSTFNPIENMNQLDVDHINTIRTDNRLENLRWTSRKENCNNPLSKIHYSESRKGENHPNAIPVVQLTLDEELVEVYGASMDAEKNGFNNSKINMCCKYKRKTHGGYKWMYLHQYIANIHPNIKQINLFGKTYEVNQ